MSNAESNSEGSSVVIVGAGPVGMSAALALRARDVPVTILEADSEDRERPGSRAIYVHGSTLQTLEGVYPGLGKRLAEAGLVWPTRRTLWRGKEVFSRTYSSPGGTDDLPHFTSLPQVRTEEFLLKACEEADVNIDWESSVTTVVPNSDKVYLETESGAEYEADYVIGADGGGSEVRHEIRAEFNGSQSENSFIIADVDEVEDNPHANERVFHYDHPAVGGRNVLLVPFQGGWRVDIQLETDDDPDAFTNDEIMRKLVGTTLGKQYRENISWVSTYQFKQVIADTFIDEHRRVLLAGEAAHLFAPFGARGMNSGIADANAAASAISVARQAKTADVAHSEIETYSAQREAAAEWNTHAAGEALDYLLGDNPVTEAKKRAAATASEWWEPAGEWLDDAPYGPRGGSPVATGRY